MTPQAIRALFVLAGALVFCVGVGLMHLPSGMMAAGGLMMAGGLIGYLRG